MFNALLRRMNGEARDLGSLAEALAQVGRDRAAARQELAELERELRQAYLDDASDAAIDKIERGIKRAEVKLEKLALTEPLLSERLREAKDEARAAVWRDLRAEWTEKAHELLESARVTALRHSALLEVVERASALGFTLEKGAAFTPTPNMGGNLVAAPALLDKFEAAIPQAAKVEAKPRTSTATSAPRFGSGHYGGGAAPRPAAQQVATIGGAQHPQDANLHLERRGKSEPGSPLASTAAPKLERVPLVPTRAPEAGEAEIIIVRTGYEAPNGQQCASGDRLIVPSEIATAAVRNGAADFVTKGGEA